jgi:hypothetical protein
MFHSHFVLSLKNSQGQILREFGNKVYLPFYEEYKIFLKNLRSQRAVVSLKIDGTDILGGNRLVIYGNDSIDLERFLEKNNLLTGRRFKFAPVEGNAQDPNSSENGIVEATIQWEAFPQITWTYSPPSGTGHYQFSTTPMYTPHYETLCGTAGTIGTINAKRMSSVSNMASFVNLERHINSSQKGVTVEGGISNQAFSPTIVSCLGPEITTIRLQILVPEQTETTVATTKKVYCINCGKKLKNNYKFCPRCGTKQE